MATIAERFNLWVEDRLGGALGGYLNDPRREAIVKARAYRAGQQKRTLKTTSGGTDDNVNINLTGLIIDRTTSLLFGGGVDFDLPGEDTSAEQEYIDNVWRLNSKDELLIDISEYGADSGTPCIQINPDGIVEGDVAYPELLTIDPLFLTIETDQENYRRVLKYVIEYAINKGTTLNPDWRTRRIEIVPFLDANMQPVSWNINKSLQDENGQMQSEPSQVWAFSFPPIVTFKNLPNRGSPYGKPDITDNIIEIQDAYNRSKSSTNKAIRLVAFQRLWGKFLKGFEKLRMGMDSILNIDNEKAEINTIDAATDFDSMDNFSDSLKRDMFMISRSPDPSTFKDKVGDLTNFGLRVLYKDAIDKLKTKRQLYGEGLKELNRRLLILNDMEGDPGEVVWADPLPENQNELVTAYKFDLDNGIASKETIREKRGYNQDEVERIAQDKLDANQNNNNIGATILQNFNRGLPFSGQR